MADAGGSSSIRRSSYAGSANIPRRLSYASVVTGAQANNLNSPARSGAFHHNAATVTNNSYPPQYQVDQRMSGGEHGMSAHRSGMSASSQRPAILPFFMPSYLENSRYARKLEAAYEVKVRALRDQDTSAADSRGPTWDSSGIARTPPIHRGMTYDVIENIPPAEDDVMPLPSKLSSTDKHQGLDLLGDHYEMRYSGVNGKDLEAASIRTDHPISPQCGIYYYEITIRNKSKDCAVAVGFSSSFFSLERLPGWEPQSWAYHGDDGKIYDGQPNGHTYRSGFGERDIIGCGIDFNKGSAFFTKNGHDLGVAFKDINFPSTPIFPCIGMKKHNGILISVNLGQGPFVYDVRNRLTEEEEKVALQISKTRTNRLHRDQPNEASFMQELVAQFLSHGGYIETSKAFSEQVQDERKALHGEDSMLPELQNADAPDVRPRQQIRQAILQGDIDTALAHTNEHFEGVLQSQSNAQIVFHLRCRKFIELVLKAAQIEKSRDSLRKNRQSSNGVSHSSAVDDVFDQPMELDDEQQSSVNGSGKAPADLSETDEYTQLTTEALEYGQTLREEFGNKSKEHDKYLHDIFSLMPYFDPSPSQNGHLLDASGRTKVAEDLNSAILISLGRSPTAALEIIWRQTEALIEVLSQDGGPAAFINLQALNNDG
ncbi:hypothetical protein OHC33_010571 [Knufia fluminis]|uniref:Protein FYV10 n=1 Tax=Knufia fluminis TaxID=191047 RepID=A0AAN8IHT5_9EURO|nr:hypothetical protein OHC33_010571 [Knufia fluminis]